MTANGEVPALEPADHELVARVNATLAEYLDIRAEELGRVHPCVAEAGEALVEFTRGGKRIRPTFAWWGWRGAGGDPSSPEADAVLRAVSALELVQANALVHDDLMDASLTRRGRPTVHVEFAARHRKSDWRGDPDRFGDAVAILLGDLALAWADDMFYGTDLAPSALRRAQPVWAGLRTDMVGGQYLDVWSQATAARDEDTALRVNRFKTAAYTIERPLQLGGAIAGAHPDLEAAYRRFGTELGIAFQLRDDQLGVFGDPEVTGKPAGDDIREGKRTVLMALASAAAERRGDRVSSQALDSALGDPDLDENGVDRIRSLLTDLGASTEIEHRIERLTESALAALGEVSIPEPAATALARLAVSATRRQA
ncbi:MAG TPA: polyprenyl synthetase family protein [Pseudonocardia sp.]|nr:polyprenyl synthetase family protein [Pseudonocardia sp.]